MSTRVFIAASAATTLTLAAVAIGGVPLLAGLGGAALAALGALPGGSRRYPLRRTGRVVGSITLAMVIVWILIFNLPDSPPIRFADDTSLVGPSGRGVGLGEPTPTGVLPALEAHGSWLGDLALGELGPETTYSETVGKGVSRTIPLSMQLLLYSQIVALVIAVPGALIGSLYRGWVADVGSRAIGLLGLSTPVYVIGPVLVLLFAVGEFSVFGHEVGFRILPSGRYKPIGAGLADHLRSMAMPSLTLGLSTAAVYLVLLRSEMIQQLMSEHALLARSKGLSAGRIVRAHALRPAASTLVAAVAAQAGLILGNLIIIERMFLLPGFGDYVIIAVIRRDLPAIAGAIFVTVAILAVVNLFADALLLAVDPRLDKRN